MGYDIKALKIAFSAIFPVHCILLKQNRIVKKKLLNLTFILFLEIFNHKKTAFQYDWRLLIYSIITFFFLSKK